MNIQAPNFAVALVHQLVTPTFVLDAHGCVIIWNAACERMTGMTATAVIGTCEHWRAFYSTPRPCLADLILQGRAAEVAQFYPSYSVKTQPDFGAHAENWCVMPLLGSQLYLAIDAGPIRDAQGQIIAVVETLRDMTARKQAEIALQLIASVFENSQEGILITDVAGYILDVNSAFTRITGYSRDEVLGKTPALLKSGVQDLAFYQNMWQQLAAVGQWQGEIWNRKRSGEFYPQLLRINAVRHDGREINHYIGMFTDITDFKNTQLRLENMANFDALTGLPNRVLLADRLQQALINAKRHERLLAVCFLDLDGFKLINDRHGHAIGDRFLIEIAHRLVHTVRNSDTVARLGGDEFVLLITDLYDMNELEYALERVLTNIAQPCLMGDLELEVSVSVGVTLYPLDDCDPDTLLRHADQSMYQAKQAGRNRYQVFDLQADSDLQTQHRHLERIRQALQHGEFRLYYQPKVNMRSGEVNGMEALIRWLHPERGLVPPLEFLPLVEHTPLIIDIGEWVMHEALEQMNQWLHAGRPLAVSVNIAARHFQHIEFVSRLRTILAEHPEVPPPLLELEILESAALSDVDMVRGVMAACQAMGVSFALDDFGTGYASLSYLKRLPADTLKIDQSFVRNMLDDPEDLAITEGVIGLARVFKKNVIAEGVETAEHGLLLMRLGCDNAQGYGISRPLPADQVREWTRLFKPDPLWALWADKPWDLDDLPLLLAQYDHSRWVRDIFNVLEQHLLPSELSLRGPCQCRFGIWYGGEGKVSYSHLPEYAEIDLIHQRMHQLSTQIIDLFESDRLDAARALRSELLELKDLILAKLSQLQQKVAQH